MFGWFVVIWKIVKIGTIAFGLYFIYSKIDAKFSIAKPFKKVFSATVDGLKSTFSFLKNETGDLATNKTKI